MSEEGPAQVPRVDAPDPLVLGFEDIGDHHGALVGAKGINLTRLWRAGFPVPGGFVVTTVAFRSSLHRHDASQALAGCISSRIDPGDPAVPGVAAAARSFVLDHGPSPEVEAAIRTAYARLAERHGAEPPVAVRSSGTLEDLADASFAGQQDTFLWVRGADEVVNHVVRCWASLYSDRAVSYRAARDLAASGGEMAVVVQSMVDPVCAGVALTLDPVTGDRSTIIVESAFGLGESVVSGDVTPDQFVVDRTSRVVLRSRISFKEREVVVADDRIGRRDLEPTRSRAPSLEHADLLRLVDLLERVEAFFGSPQDIEWARLPDDVEPGRFVILQSRPETVWSRRGLASAPVVSADPCGLPAPRGAEDWRSMYPAHLLHDADDTGSPTFWFHDKMHWAKVLAPFEVTVLEYSLTSLSQYNSRHFLAPDALGLEVRIVNGYCYLSPIPVADRAVVERRATEYAARSALYYADWDGRYATWRGNVRRVIDELEAIEFAPLPPEIGRDDVERARVPGPPARLTESYHQLLDRCLDLWQYHFELLNLGYAAFAEFFRFCKETVDGIGDLEVAAMVAGIDGELFRPAKELRRLARSAVALGLGGLVLDGDVADALAAVAASPEADGWWKDYQSIQDPWFNYSSGSGMYHDDPVWRDRPEIPFEFLRGYVATLLDGGEIESPSAAVASERDRVTAEHLERMEPTRRDEFVERLELARTVHHYVENHNFYIEHWGMSVVWRKLRDLSQVFVDAGYWRDADAIVLLRREEIGEALWEMASIWATGRSRPSTGRWEREIDRRRAMLAACGEWQPPATLGRPPDQLAEPFTAMLWGITADSARAWAEPSVAGDRELSGFAASAGVATGRARVILRPEDISSVGAGEVLVTQLTAPSWAPVFCRVAATVTDTGGMMSHAAIVCREYGLPAVTGTGVASRTIRTGDLVRVDGNTGRVTILDEGDGWTS